MLAGCSSPPPPPPVNWSGSAIEINSTMPTGKKTMWSYRHPSSRGTGQKRFMILMEKKEIIFPMITLLSLMPIRLWY